MTPHTVATQAATVAAIAVGVRTAMSETSSAARKGGVNATLKVNSKAHNGVRMADGSSAIRDAGQNEGRWRRRARLRRV